MNFGLVLSGGVGSRLGLSIPKQYVTVNQKMIIEYAMEGLIKSGKLDGLVVVADAKYRDEIKRSVESLTSRSRTTLEFLDFANPGDNRQMSVYNGLLKLEANGAKENDKVIIHDAARPNTSVELIESCFDYDENYQGAIPVIPMKDTIYLSNDGTEIENLVNRSVLYAGQAPEVFDFGAYFKANEDLIPNGILRINGSSEVAIMAGMKIKMVPGNDGNYKITTKEDLERFKLSKEGGTTA